MHRILSALLLACAFVCAAGPSAHASTFDVSPITLTLSAKTTSSMLLVTNQSPEPLRFHVTAFTWQQRADGEMVLTPTKDVVFFPALLTLNPGEARNLRVGMNIKPGAVEKTYRVFVQELPPLQKQGEEGVVRMLTKMGVPLFVEPAGPKAQPAVAGLAMKGNTLSFNLQNAGNAHYRADKIVITAKDGTKVVHTQELTGWYTLAQGTRAYAITLPKEVCSAVKSVDVELKSDKGTVKAALANARCAI